ncbi:hypothetical protein CRG98_024976 [Punica granatum]|uniref:CAAX prenyl protease 2/Lysostaphin resistance protein A-like domain-containing protein n=1 Tax=Punica granatum TaxID=22663 RepID=A0A2I0JEE2_PUNGR|nr:hypothetical protein CRG98_024976 [Punica granatum]
MILALSLTYPASATRRRAITPFPSPTFFVSLSKFPSNCGSRTSFKCSCTENGDTHEASFQGFSVLGPESDVPWDSGTVWSTLSFYLFSLHIPLSFGGLSIVAHVLHQPILDPQTESVNNSVLKEILLSSNLSRAACSLAYCIIIPLLEELVYRGFLLRSISRTMKWHQAVLLSSAIFSAIHFSGENSLQLFIIGCVLGCCYCWTGDLKSSVLVHSLYNAMILVITYVS